MKVYSINDYIQLLKDKNFLVEQHCEAILDKEVNYISYNSKDVKEDTLFIVKGINFKAEYLTEAINQGVFCYVSEFKLDNDVPYILVNDIKKVLSFLAVTYFDYPQKNLNVIAVGGTKGKSTTTYYIKEILEVWAKATGQKEPGVISTVDTYDGIEKFESHITTPESYEIHRHFSNANKAGLKNMVMECSSQSFKVDRVADVNFDMCVFTNISEDHISPIEHPNFEDYYNCKLQMFTKAKKAVVNMDGDYASNTVAFAKENCEKVYTYSTKDTSADFYGYEITKHGFNTSFKAKTPTYEMDITLSMSGLFNVENALAAIGVAYDMGIEPEYIIKGLYQARCSGRMDLFATKDMKIVVVVDYAHNTLSFEKLFESVSEEYPTRKKIIVFGCPGTKAKNRRKDLGIAAGKLADEIVICAEDPGQEPFEDINKDIIYYVEQYTHNYRIIEDRGEALKQAMIKAKGEPGQAIIMVTGKGNETRQKYGLKFIDCPSDVENAITYVKAYDDGLL